MRRHRKRLGNKEKEEIRTAPFSRLAYSFVNATIGSLKVSEGIQAACLNRSVKI